MRAENVDSLNASDGQSRISLHVSRQKRAARSDGSVASRLRLTIRTRLRRSRVGSLRGPLPAATDRPTSANYSWPTKKGPTYVGPFEYRRQFGGLTAVRSGALTSIGP